MQTPLNQTLAYAVSQLRADFVAFSSRKLEALGITQGLLYFVLYIGRHPGCTPSDLSAALHADSGHTTRSIHKLEETGFVIRKAHPTDRRASVLEPTRAVRPWKPAGVCLPNGTPICWNRSPKTSAVSSGNCSRPCCPTSGTVRLSRTVPMVLLPSGAGCPNDQTRIALMMRQYVPFFVVS